jgi:uncharacterized protein (DUF427 family)
MSLKVPGPDHPIVMNAHPGRVRVHFAGQLVADTESALVLEEADLPPVFYIPRADARMDLMVRSSRESHCPYKGQANYYSVQVDGRTADNAVWTYEQPSPHVASIKDRLAFYPDKVEFEVD